MLSVFYRTLVLACMLVLGGCPSPSGGGGGKGGKNPPVTGATLRFYWTNEYGELASTNSETTLSKSTADILLVSANDDETYTNHRWYVNGVEDTSCAGQDTYTFSSSVREVRSYTLTLYVKNGSSHFNTTFIINVVE